MTTATPPAPDGAAEHPEPSQTPEQPEPPNVLQVPGHGLNHQASEWPTKRGKARRRKRVRKGKAQRAQRDAQLRAERHPW